MMSVSRRLQAHRQAVASALPVAALPQPDPTRLEDEEDESTANPKEGTKKKEKPMADEPVSAADHASAIADATAKATAAANARFSAVLASDEYQGREALATTLLGNASMDAPAIIAALATAPKAAAPVASEADLKAAEEKGAQAAMLAAQAGDKNSNLEDGDGSKKDTAKTSAQVWDTAMSNVFPKKAK